jgi:hypothetical protein
MLQQVKLNFERMGARVNIRKAKNQVSHRTRRPLAIDVVNGGSGECFDIHFARNVSINVLDVRPRLRHLLLSAWNWFGEDRFLCGHDEYHWFVAALPAQPEAQNVESAMESLKPDLVKTLEGRKHRGKHHRKADVFVRQGEWFFIPWPHASIDRNRVERNGRLARGAGSKPHVCDFMFQDGEREYICDRYPKLAFYESEYREVLRARRKAKQWNWRPLPFKPDVYVKGWIKHPDHSPLFLDVWHRVEQNTESTNLSMSRMVYRD